MGNPSKQPKWSVLIVEDEASYRSYFSSLWKQAGCDVAAAVPTATEALSFLEKQVPDAISLDLNLAEGQDGLTVLDHLNRNPKFQGIVRVIATNDVRPQQIATVNRLGSIAAVVNKVEADEDYTLSVLKRVLAGERHIGTGIGIHGSRYENYLPKRGTTLIAWVGTGADFSTIAEAMGVTPEVVRKQTRIVADLLCARGEIPSNEHDVLRAFAVKQGFTKQHHHDRVNAIALQKKDRR